MLNKITAFFQTLRGKLILTYTTVTVLSLMALEVTLLVFLYVVSGGADSDTQSYLSDVISVLPPQARTYLQPGSQDLPGLQAWLQATYDAGYASLPPQGIFDSPAAGIVKSDPMYVLSPDGTVIAAAPESSLSLVGRKYSPPSEVARSDEVLANALGDAENRRYSPSRFSVSRLSAIRPNGSYLMAVPVTQSIGEGPVVAVIVVTVKAPPPAVSTLWPAFTVFIGTVAATGILLLLAVAPFGAVFGFIMSHGLTRRLKALSQAADAWSEGDFSVQPQDQAKDEISYLGVRMRRMAENVQALLQTQHELALMEERNRLARELHDTVKQQIFSTLMQLRGAQNYLDSDPAAARRALQEAEGLLKASQQDLGLILTELRPAALEGSGLAAALQNLLETWNQHTRILSELRVQGDSAIPLGVEQALYRIVQEALSNVARHSSASAVTVELGCSAQQVRLVVQDNGCGFDPSAVADRTFGLQSMQQRAAALGGTLQITSEVGSGTTVTVQVPLSTGG